MGEVKGLASALEIIDELELYAETAAAAYKERIGTIRWSEVWDLNNIKFRVSTAIKEVEGLASASRIIEKLELYAETVVMGEVKGLASAMQIVEKLELYAATGRS